MRCIVIPFKYLANISSYFPVQKLKFIYMALRLGSDYRSERKLLVWNSPYSCLDVIFLYFLHSSSLMARWRNMIRPIFLLVENSCIAYNVLLIVEAARSRYFASSALLPRFNDFIEQIRMRIFGNPSSHWFDIIFSTYCGVLSKLWSIKGPSTNFDIFFLFFAEIFHVS